MDAPLHNMTTANYHGMPNTYIGNEQYFNHVLHTLENTKTFKLIIFSTKITNHQSNGILLAQDPEIVHTITTALSRCPSRLKSVRFEHFSFTDTEAVTTLIDHWLVTGSNERLSSLRFTRCVINHAFTNKLALGLKQCTRLRTLNLDALF